MTQKLGISLVEEKVVLCARLFDGIFTGRLA
jgi:hypothetical protein